MEKLSSSGKYSLKNIPIPTDEKDQEYNKKALSQMEHFLRRMRWRAIYYQKYIEKQNNPNDDLDETFDEDFETYGFKSELKPPPVPDLADFEKACWDLIKNIEFKKVSNKFQNELISDLNRIKREEKVIVSADKTNNQYKCSKATYDKILKENITKEYKIASTNSVKNTDIKSANFAHSLKLEKRMQNYTNSEAFITLKDHKPDFLSKLPARLINPAKNDLGKVSKIILQQKCSEVRYHTNHNQWRSTQSVLEWFRGLENTTRLKFFKFDIVNFYPAISLQLMKNALQYAKSINGVIITKSEEEIIYHCRETYLFNDNKPWVKKETGKEKFDVPQGSYDGAEACELVGLYILHKLTKGKDPIFKKEHVGLYRDDGLAVFKGSARDAETKIKRKVKQVFREEGLEITTEAACQITDFLDIVLDLSKHVHHPYRKPNDTPMYININSNHPKSIIKQIKPSLEKRLSILSSNKEIFDAAKGPYEKALKDSGHDHILNFQPRSQKPKRKRRRKVIYCNLPHSNHVKTNVGRKFLNLVTHHFPKEHPLRKIFNRNTIKFSPCTLTNMKQKFSKINAKILNKKESKELKKCNCARKYKNNCPVKGSCQEKSLVYQANVISAIETKVYYGSTKNDFKTRFNQHISSFNRRPEKSSTTLAKYVNELIQRKIEFNIKWSIKAKAHSFSSGSSKCDLCITEKLVILKADPSNLLNKRDELLAKCPHKGCFYLNSIKV